MIELLSGNNLTEKNPINAENKKQEHEDLLKHKSLIKFKTIGFGKKEDQKQPIASFVYPKYEPEEINEIYYKQVTFIDLCGHEKCLKNQWLEF